MHSINKILREKEPESGVENKSESVESLWRVMVERAVGESWWRELSERAGGESWWRESWWRERAGGERELVERAPGGDTWWTQQGDSDQREKKKPKQKPIKPVEWSPSLL